MARSRRAEPQPQSPSSARARSWLRSLGVAAAVTALCCALLALPAWRLVDAKLFDLMSTQAPPQPAEPGAVVVAIDEPSFAEIGRQWPWPRDLHARLIRSLREAGARVIGLDIIFSEPSTPEADAALAAALGPDVVLAADEARIETPQAEQVSRIEPLPAFTATGATAGVVAVALDRDGALRRIPSYPDGFAASLLARRGEGQPIPQGALLQVFGPARTFPTVSYYQALDPAEFLPKDYFRGRTVLVGLSLQSAATIAAGSPDSFATPFSLRTGQLTPGVEIQATILDNLRTGLFIRPLPAAGLIAIIALVALAAAALTHASVTWRAAASTGLGILLLVLASFLLLRTGRVWVPPSLPVLAAVLVTGWRGGRDFARERRQRHAITRAFSHYLAPALVERLAADPSGLRLGGERRELSILFCDVRGFTGLAETMKDRPERLTALIHRLLNPLSEAVLEHGGTIDKYIGDCVMAFWNAPLDDADHAAHAVACALAMLARLDALNAELAREAPGLAFAVGIGVNTGDCVVGNLGSDRRFDYSALGDAVNLASRLEGLSKRYGVPLVIGPQTAARLGTGARVVELDKVAVRGRSEPIAVFTVLRTPPADAAAFRHAHEAMLAAYRARDWEAAEAGIARCRPLAPELEDYYAAVLGWIAALRQAPPGDGWQAAYQG